MLLASLLLTLTLLMSGCAGLTPTQTAQTVPQMPYLQRPVLLSLTATPDGGIQMGRHDAAMLLNYVETLEEIVGVVR